MEDRVFELASRIAALESRVNRAEQTMEENRKLLLEIKSKLDRWEGKIGGVLFLAWCLWMFFSGAAKSFLDWIALSGKG